MSLSVKEAVLTIEAVRDEIGAVEDFLDELMDGVPCTMEEKVKLRIVAEEIFVNIASYAYQDAGGKATIRGRASSDPPCSVTLIFEDRGKPFDPLGKAPPDLTPDVRKRAAGGLGIFLVRNLVSEIYYDHRDGKNILTVKKNVSG